MKKVLVTGANGFIGKHALKTLVKQGFEVHAVSSEPMNPSTADNCIFHAVNLLDFTQINGLFEAVKPAYLLHLAWDVTPGEYWNSANNFLWVQASLEMLGKFQEHGGRRVVMAGTCAEYDWRYGYCSEPVTPKVPATPYGVCKLALQTMLASYSAQTGLSSAWGRIFFLYGPYEHPARLVPSVVKSLLKGEPVPCTHGNQIRDFLYVQDVADAFVALLASDISGAVNIASGCPVAVKDVICKIAEILKRKDLIQLGSIPAAGEPPLLVADTGRLANEVNWLPKYNLDQGLEETVNWWKSFLKR